uniref:ADP-ribosylation factor-like protein 6-interacting protein 4 n=1 Tax=Anopheles christyi TaxID=43041 RepID=A0A182K439_9DIPT
MKESRKRRKSRRDSTSSSSSSSSDSSASSTSTSPANSSSSSSRSSSVERKRRKKELKKRLAKQEKKESKAKKKALRKEKKARRKQEKLESKQAKRKLKEERKRRRQEKHSKDGVKEISNSGSTAATAPTVKDQNKGQPTAAGPPLLDCGIPLDLMNRKAMAPETREEYEARQSILRRVVDPETGRTRLIKGDGEIIEECVTRDRHKEINRQATVGDGAEFQRKTLGRNVR